MADEAKAYIRKNFLEKEDGMILKPFRANQTPALFLLKFGLLENEKAIAATKAALFKNIKDHKGCLTTGFLGTSILMDTVTYEAGAPDVAYSLLLQHENPSWLYSVDQGATTIWERWNSYVKATGFGPVGMNSFNHYAYGAVMGWMYRTMAGIRPGKEAGFARFTLAPKPDKRVGWCKASYRAAQGTIKSHWRYEKDGRLVWSFTVPPGTVADVIPPSGGAPRVFGPGEHVVAD
jgi:alpha-L-rhamnosidase